MSAPGKKSAPSPDDWLVRDSDEEDSSGSEAPAGAIGAETAQWIVEPAPEQNGAKAAPAPPPPAPPPAKVEVAAPEPPPAEDVDLARRVRDLQTQLRVQEKESKAELAAALKEQEAAFMQQSKSADTEAKAQLDLATGELAKKHNSREERLTKTFERRESELRERIDELESELADSKKTTEEAKAAASKRRKDASQPKKAPAAKSKGARGSKPKEGESDLNEITFEQLRDLGLSITQSARVIAYRDVRGGFDSLGELDEIPGLPKETRADLRKRLSVSS